MNKQFYRVIFSKTRGMFIAVSEIAKSADKSSRSSKTTVVPTSESDASPTKPLSYTRLALAILCCQSMVYTQVHAANSQIQNNASDIAAAQRAALLKAANGTPIVNIRTPNSKGLSHNTYNQFDIGDNGAILNNSIAGANTHLAGAIAGNQYLAKAAANTILNEVRSDRAAQINGNIEIAGQAADIIIASPSGLQIQGGGFINANNATLTTGTPNIDSTGELTSFNVQKGTIRFDNSEASNKALGGALYDGKRYNQANYVDILARAVEVNGDLHANKTLNVVTGNNKIDYETLSSSTLRKIEASPTLALDVSNLGGIYANSINLIGTESGLGVRNAGNIIGSQQVVLNNTGKIENTGLVRTKTYDSYIGINAIGSQGNIEHSGTIKSYGMIDINADKNIDINHGIIRKDNNAGRAKYTPDILNINAKVHVNVNDASDIRNYTSADRTNLYVNSGYDTKIDGKSIIASNGGITVNADRSVKMSAGSQLSANGAPLNLYSKSTMTIDNSQIKSKDDVNLNAHTSSHLYIQNKSTVSSEKDVNLNSSRNIYLATGSRISQADNVNIQAGDVLSIDGSGGIEAKGDANIKAGGLAYIRNNQPINIEKSLNIEGDRALISTSSMQGKDGVTIRTDGRDSAISNSQINSENGAVSAIAKDGTLTAINLTTNAKTAILASTDTVSVSSSQLNADNVIASAGENLNISSTTIASKDSEQVGSIKLDAKAKATLSKSNLTSTGVVSINADTGIALNNDTINADTIALKTNVAKTEKNAEGATNTFGDGDVNIVSTQLSATNGTDSTLIADAANHLNVIDSTTTSTGSTSIKSGNLTRLNNSDISAGKHLSVNSNDQLIINGERYNENIGTDTAPKWRQSLRHTKGETKLQADEVLSVNSNSDQSYQNADIQGGAALIDSNASINFEKEINVNVASNYKLLLDTDVLSNGTSVSTLNGDLSISSKNDLTIDPTKLNIVNDTTPFFWFGEQLADVSLASRNGKLYLKGYSGIQGQGSENIIKLTTSGDINLSGKEVLIEGSDLSSSKIVLDYENSDPFKMGTPTTLIPTGAINITATDGNVELKGVKNSFSNYVSQYKIDTINYEIQKAKAELDLPFNDTDWLEDYIKIETDFKASIKQSCIRSSYKSSSECNLKRPNAMDYVQKYEPIYFQALQTSGYKKYKSYLDNQNDLKRKINDLVEIAGMSAKASTGFEHKAVSLTAGKDVNITAKQGVLIEGADITSSNGGIIILAEGNLAPTDRLDADGKRIGVDTDSIVITGLADIYQQGDIKDGQITGPNYSDHQLINQSKLKAKGDIKIAATGNSPLNTESNGFYDSNAVVLNSVDIQSTDGDVRIDAARGDIHLEASQVRFLDGSQKTETSRTWYGKKKTKTTTKTNINSNAVTTDISANNISLTAESDINIYGSELNAKSNGNIGITAGRELNLYSIDNIQESKTDVKKRSSWVGIRYNKDHTNDTRLESTQLPTELIGGKTYTQSGSNTLLEGTIFNTLDAANIVVGKGKYADDEAKVILAPVINQIETTHNQEKESTVWQKTVVERDTVTTAALPKFNQTPTITAPGGVVIEVPVEVDISDNNKAKLEIQRSQKELGKIALELATQPGYEYLAELDKNNEINWVQVQLIQEHYELTQEGLTPAAAALIAIAVTIALQGMDGGGVATSLLGQHSAIAATATTAAIPSTVTTLGVAGNAAFASLASQAAVGVVNNKGDIGKTLKDLASSDTVRSMATAALTAGVGAKLNLAGGPDYSFSENLAKGIGRGITDAVADAALNGVSFEDALKDSLRNSLVDVLSAEVLTHGAKNIDSDATDAFARNLAHKLAAGGVGCLSAKAKDQSCDAGALGAIVGEMVGDYMVELGAEGDLTDDQISKITNTAKLTAGSVALLAGVDVDVAANSAVLAVENNSTAAKPTSPTGMLLVIGGVVYQFVVPAKDREAVAAALYNMKDGAVALGKNAATNATALQLFVIANVGSQLNVHVRPVAQGKAGSGVLINPQTQDTFQGIPGLEIQDVNSILNGLGKPVDNNTPIVLIKPQHSKSASDYVIYNNVDRVSSKNSLPSTREELRKDLKSKGFEQKGMSESYEVWKKNAEGDEGQITINIKPTGEVIRSQQVWRKDGSRKYAERQDYFGNRLPDQSHSTGHFVK